MGVDKPFKTLGERIRQRLRYTEPDQKQATGRIIRGSPSSNPCGEVFLPAGHPDDWPKEYNPDEWDQGPWD